MGGSKGGGAGKKSSKQLAAATQEIANQTRPAREQYFRDLSSALAGRPQDIPTAQMAYKTALASSNQTVQQLRQSYGKSGVEARFANPALDQARMEGGRSAEDARQAIVSQLLGQAPSAVLGTTAQGQQGLLSSAQRGFGIAAAQQAQNTQLAGAGAAALASILVALL